MSIFPVLSFVVFLLYLQAGLFVIFRFRRDDAKLYFSILCFSFAIFAFFSTFIYSATSIQHVYIYDRLASFGWTTFPVLMVAFFCKISKNESLFIKNVIHYILVPISVMSFLIVLFDLESLKLYYKYNNTWLFELNNRSTWVNLFILYLFISVALSLYLLINWYLSAQTNREKKQVTVITVSLLAFFLASTFTNIILPYFNISFIPALAPVNSIIWIAGVYYSMVRYHENIFSGNMQSGILLNHIDEFVMLFDSNKNLININRYTLNTLKYSYNEILKLPKNKLFVEYKVVDDYFGKLNRYSASPHLMIKMIKADGRHIPVLLSGFIIKNDVGCVLTGRDVSKETGLKNEISERIDTEGKLNETRDQLEFLVQENTSELSEANKKLHIEILESERAEAQISHDLKEKTKLVSEVHHRVKNNFQIIISLTNMLTSHQDIDKEGSGRLSQIADRVRTISAIHEDFYSSENLSRIDFNKFLKRIVEELNIQYGQNKAIKFKLNISEPYFDIDKAIPCGIICFELLSNAIKFAFPADNQNKSDDEIADDFTIKIDLLRKSNEYTLRIIDNGIGIPDDCFTNQSKSVGLQMVEVLAERHLRGTLVVNNSAGTSITLLF